MKNCPKCKINQPKSEFSKDKNKKDGLRCYCKSCEKKYGKQYYLNNKEKVSKRMLKYNKKYRKTTGYKKSHRKYKLKSTYDITLEDYDNLLKFQNNKCAICECESKISDGRNRRLHVDHDHKTGKIRGLLCKGCNTSLGVFKDSKEILQRAINYLNK